jgi:hypothetical protein
MKDSGERTIFDGKAMREVVQGKGRYDLISPFAIKRLAIVLEKGAVKYDDRNWEKGGIKFSRYIDSAMRHLNQYVMGMRDEDHLAQAMYNIMAILHFDELGDFTDDNLPKYPQKIKPETKVEEKEIISAATNNIIINDHFEEELRQALAEDKIEPEVKVETKVNKKNKTIETIVEKNVDTNDETGDW